MEGVGFYLDGGCFTHKMNPFDQSRGPVAMTWRNPGQGFDFSFTGKRSHEGTGGTVAHFMAGWAYGKGVTAAEQYHGRKNTEKFSSFVHEHFASMFKIMLTQGENFSYRMVILHETVWKPDPPGMRLAFENLPFQQEFQIWNLSKISSILSSGGCIKMFWINR